MCKDGEMSMEQMDAAPRGEHATASMLEKFALIVMFSLLLAGVYLVLRPFQLGLLFGVILAVAAWPLRMWLLHMGLSRSVAAGLMLVTLLVARRATPRFAVPLALQAGLAVVWIGPGLTGPSVSSTASVTSRASLSPLAWPPEWSLTVFLSVALPLFVVTMASQNLPGVAVLRASGYGRAPVSILLTIIGLVSLVLAPFGVFALNLAAITAALCMGPDAHPDPNRRWLAAAAAGVLYMVVGLFAAPLAAFFLALPRELVATIAGLALLPTIGRGLHAALADEGQRDAALVTFLVTASGLTLWGIGPAFWGVVFGVVALLVWRPSTAA
jgi:benzoate membrane transport protein